MKRALVLGWLAGCAGPRPVPVCDPEGVIVDPEIARVGSDDILSASVSYDGCEPTFFLLCGVDEAWLDRGEARMELWHDASLFDCAEPVLADAEVSLRPVREAYEKLFDVEEAAFTLLIGDVEVEYAFAPVEPE